MLKRALTREQIARRIAQDLPDGASVNLGIGIPTLVSRYIPAGREVIVHSENGLLGIGPPPPPGQEDANLINASKEYVTLVPGASFFHQADSFSMTRGKHIDIGVLGGMQVAENGDLANWKVQGATLGSIGGAMDIAMGAKQIFVAMSHATSKGQPKIVRRLTYPLTALRCVNRIFTELAVIDVTASGLVLRELAPGYTVADVQGLTEARLHLEAEPIVLNAD